MQRRAYTLVDYSSLPPLLPKCVPRSHQWFKTIPTLLASASYATKATKALFSTDSAQHDTSIKFSGCVEPGCIKWAQGSTMHCIAHGGGRRCQEKDCTKSALGSTKYCVAHGGGRRCQEKDCTRSAVGRTEYCAAHGGGKRCQEKDCTKSAQGRTDHCVDNN